MIKHIGYFSKLGLLKKIRHNFVQTLKNSHFIFLKGGLWEFRQIPQKVFRPFLVVDVSNRILEEAVMLGDLGLAE
jgi:hypothetical protein